MSQPKERHYIDVHGNKRHAILVKEKPNFFVPYLIGHPPSPVSIWLIDGAQLQIPDRAWDLVKSYDPGVK